MNENAMLEEQIHIIITIPKNAASIEITATMIGDDGIPFRANTVMKPEDIRTARQDFLDNVEGGDDFDAVYTLTEKGREIYEQLANGDATCEDLLEKYF